MPSIADFIFFASFIIIGATITFSPKFLSPGSYSKLLLATICISILVMSLFQILDIMVDGNTPVHSALITFAQYGVYALAFKLWLSINYPNFSRGTRTLMHMLSHTVLLLVIVTSYWFKSQYSFLLVIVNPIVSLSVALIAETIEETMAQRVEKK